ADAKAVAADLGSSHPLPISVENGFRLTASIGVARPHGPSSVCALASLESEPDLQSTTRNPTLLVIARTIVHAQLPPSQLAPRLLSASARDKTFRLPLRCASVAVPRTLLFRYLHTQSVESSGDNLRL